MATHRLDYLLVQRKNLLAFALILSSLILDIVTHFQRRIQIHQCLTIIVHGHTWGHFCLIDFLWGNWVERFNWFFVSLVLWISIERALKTIWIIVVETLQNSYWIDLHRARDTMWDGLTIRCLPVGFYLSRIRSATGAIWQAWLVFYVEIPTFHIGYEIGLLV